MMDDEFWEKLCADRRLTILCTKLVNTTVQYVVLKKEVIFENFRIITGKR